MYEYEPSLEVGRYEDQLESETMVVTVDGTYEWGDETPGDMEPVISSDILFF